MKKILKRIGVLGLILAILAPFTKLPIVNAEESNCETHLQNYMFLDVTMPSGFPEYTDNDGYTTYGNFPYMFSSNDTSTINIKSVTKNNVITKNNIDAYWSLYKTVYNYANTSKVYRFQDPYQNGKVFVATENPNYETDTILLHGQWAMEDENGYPIISKWDNYDNEKTLQEVFIKKEITNEFNDAVIDGATFINNKFSSLTGNGYKNNLTNYFTELTKESTVRETVWTSTKNNQTYVPLKITRTIDEDALNGLIFGTVVGNNIEVFSMPESTTVKYTDEINKNNIEDSYDAYIEWYNLSDSEKKSSPLLRTLKDGNESDLDINTNVPYYWPFVLNVEYEVCAKEDAPAQWTLEYNGNVTDNSVTNLPKSQSADVGSSITVDAGKPSRDGYTFKKWCETIDGSSNCYNPGEQVTSDTKATVTLYAQWAKTGSEENEKTGVVSYIIGFAAVGVVAGGIYLISKKKNLFKQI